MEAMSRKQAKHKTTQDNEEDLRLFCQHLKALGLRTAEQYKAWCGKHGFNRRTNKSCRQRERERLVTVREVASVRLVESKQAKRRLHDTIKDIFSGRLRGADVRDPCLHSLCGAYEIAKKDRRMRSRLLDLLLHVEPITEFLSTTPVILDYGRQPGNTCIDGLLCLAHHWCGWLRPVEEWKPRTHNLRRQFASLARHLLSDYPTPAFMDSVWFQGTSSDASRRQRWYRHVGIGKNIRTADLPIPLTKRMAHHFLEAPNDSSMEQALRWGQVIGLGGDPRLAKAILATRLAEDFGHDEFWTSVVRFFIEHPMLDTARIGPIIDYLHHQRFVEREEFVQPGVIRRQGPPRPNLSMKGRDPVSLLRQVDRWHRSLAHESVASGMEWPNSRIAGFNWVEGTEGSPSLRRWTIHELLGSKQLVAEGRAMRNCVASYAGSCARRRTSIWSLKLENHEGTLRVLTVEVHLQSKQICQARGKHNRMADTKSKDVLRRWAAKEGLRLAAYV